MKNLIIAFLMVVALSTPAYAFTHEIMQWMLGKPQVALGGANGGSGCAGCTLVMALIGQTMQVKNTDAKGAYATVCGYFPKALSDVCVIAADLFGPMTYDLLNAKETPDDICNTLGMCKDETAVCRLFPAKNNMNEHQRKLHVQNLKIQHPADNLRAFNVCTIIPGICNVENHLPFSDADGDRYSTEPQLRGTDWRGKDCNDADNTVYPGRQSSDATADQNCNGIFGVNPTTGGNYEDELCAGTGAMGVSTLGDSASAHFRIPQEMLMAGVMNKDTFAKLLEFATDEADWPMLSWATGHSNSTAYNPSVAGPMISVYSRMNELNKCNHRDYQNLGVNGARVTKYVEWVDLLARNGATDKPMLSFFAMVGNDVCNGHHTFDTMTTPTDFYTAVYNGVMAADKKYPYGSHIVFVPLVDGRILYNTMHDQIHPIGALNKDVTYTAFYDYLNCVESSPCWGWMNSNETVRNLTYARSLELNAQYPQIIKDLAGKLTNVQLHYFGDLFAEAINAYPGPKVDLIEPVDGFHPSQLANAYLGNLTFNTLQANGVVSATPNPNNAKIQGLFGDQGGY